MFAQLTCASKRDIVFGERLLVGPSEALAPINLQEVGIPEVTWSSRWKASAAQRGN